MTQTANPPAKRRELSLRSRLLIAFPIVVIVGLSLLPTWVFPLADEYIPIEDRTHRKKTAGPGLALVTKDVREEDVTFPARAENHGLVNLRGTLSLPASSGPRPALILLHGSGPSSRNGELAGDLLTKVSPPYEILRAFADFFAHEGFVVLRWDKRGPKQYPELASHLDEFQFADFEADAHAAIDYLETRPEVQKRMVVVAGHSEGGGIAVQVVKNDPRTIALVMLAGFPDTFDGAAWQIENSAELRLKQGDVIGYASLSIMASQARTCLAKSQEVNYRGGEKCSGTTLERIRDNHDYETATLPSLKAVLQPIFALQGSVDRNLDPTTIERLRKALPDRDVELHYVRNLSHLLVDVDAKGPPAIPDEVKRRLHLFLTSLNGRSFE